MAKEYRIWVGGEAVTTADRYEVRAPYDNSVVGITYRAGGAEIEKATAAAVKAFEETGKMAPFQRAETLEKVSSAIEERKEEIARVIAGEAGKPITTARVELARSVFTFKWAAEEAKRMSGEIMPLDVHPLAKGHTAFIKRFPVGPVIGISPFNFPMNLVAHKVAPALAAGCPIVIKPASQTPLTALILAEIVDAAGWPKGGMSVLPCKGSDAEVMVTDPRYKKLTFTGSPEVGWGLKARAGRKRVTLELGGNAGVIVHSDADLEDAATRIAAGGFGYAGQTCISVQRIFVHRPAYEKFRDIFVAKVKALKTGDPLDDATAVGPVINEDEAKRVEEWIKEAVDDGAALLCGGGRSGAVVEPTVLENAAPELKVNCEEVFGPVVTLVAYDDVDEAIAAVNDSDFGLQAGIFTNDLNIAFNAWERIEAGGVNVNNVPTFRIDHMPYGGVKASGLGREGLKYAIEEMTELRNMVINRP